MENEKDKDFETPPEEEDPKDAGDTEEIEEEDDFDDDFFGLSEIEEEPEEQPEKEPDGGGEEEERPADGKEDKAEEKPAEEPEKPEGADFGKRAADDLAELKALYPELGDLGSLHDLSNARRFGELRDLGLSVKEAFLASSSDDLVRRAEARGAAKESAKSHLTAVSRRSAAANSEKMSAKQRETLREFFGEDEMSDEELDALWAKTKK